jgi:hypothetical protein
VDPVHRSTVDRSKGYAPLLIWVVRAHRTAPVACGRRAAGRRSAPAAERWRLTGDLVGDGGLGVTVHYLRRGLNREKEEDVAELTRDSLTMVGRRRRRVAVRGGRDHGCPPGRGLRPRVRASAHWDEPLVYLCLRG